MRRVIFNQKGGVGKSTIASNLAAMAAHQGLRTLVLDLDPQGNATRYLLGENPESADETLAGYFEDTLSHRIYSRGPDAFVWRSPFQHLSVMPSHPALETLQGRLESRYKIYKLRDSLAALEGFDRVYIDTPPALNFYTLSALIAADRCLIPFDCDAFARQALDELMASAAELKADHNPALEVEGVIVNQFQSRARLPASLVESLKADGNTVLEPFLSASVKVRESHQVSKPLVHLAPRHKLTAEYEALHQRLESA
ncbi:chromosome partitioning protein [Spiribacter salinus M19-40]|uniref:Chromosome partitioning protein n=1 Tax=Spiribacter salinus M19-40 TaxID=1260251 RepID=R4V7G8_9GAMM|nr:ParA family protein [Spiribacter salinus]AGM40955.1 chromosome partitioning protein [Spiribacter salinus M19-40]